MQCTSTASKLLLSLFLTLSQALAVLGLQGKTKNFEFKYFSNRPITEEEYSYFKTVQLKVG